LLWTPFKKLLDSRYFDPLSVTPLAIPLTLPDHSASYLYSCILFAPVV